MAKGSNEKRTTKYELVQAVYGRLGGFSKKEAADLVDQIFDLMKETLGRGENIKISGFGNFVMRDKKERQGRNPQTGEPITISARTDGDGLTGLWVASLTLLLVTHDEVTKT